MADQPQLAPSETLDIGTLASLFRNTTTSYKLLFFLALLRCLDRRTEAAPQIPFREMVVEQLAIAWYPHTLFKLSFGSQDQVAHVLTHVAAGVEANNLRFTSADLHGIRRAIERTLDDRHHQALMRYVPYRLIAPFFGSALRGVADTQKNARIQSLARKTFERGNPPLYCFQGPDVLVVHPDWARYLRTNRGIVEGWATWHWLRYMQAQNPNVPGVGGKLLPVIERASLALQTEYWVSASREAPLRCLYSDAALERPEALDHFMPWSFVLHDRIWNLAPTTASINSAKGHRLPELTCYLPRLAAAHSRALPAARKHLGRRKWERLASEFQSDLAVDRELFLTDPMDPETLRSALEQGYRKTVPHLHSLAANQGFEPGWVLQPTLSPSS